MTPSPCTGVCRLGPGKVCEGCGRTLDEIARWGAAGEAEKAAIVARATIRRGVQA